jgi:hypothetical protein
MKNDMPLLVGSLTKRHKPGLVNGSLNEALFRSPTVKFAAVLPSFLLILIAGSLFFLGFSNFEAPKKPLTLLSILLFLCWTTTE